MCVALEGEPGIGKTRLLVELTQLRRGARPAGPDGIGDRVRARPAVQRVGRRARRVRRFPGARPARGMGCGRGRRARRGHPVRAAIGRPRASSVADERYRAHRAVRGCWSCSRSTGRSCWCSTTCTGATARRSSCSARCFVAGRTLPCCSRSRSGADRRLRVCPRRSRRRRRDGSQLEQLDEAQATELLADLDPQAAAAIYRHGGGNPFYLEQLARAGVGETFAATSSGNGTGVAGADIPAAVAASLAEELASLSALERVLLEAAAVAGEPFEPDLAAVIAELPTSEGLAALDALLELDLLRPTACRAGSSSATRSCAARCTRARAAAGGSRRTRARRASWRREAPPPASGRTTSSSRPRRATRRRSHCCSKPARQRRRALPRSPSAGSKATLRLLPLVRRAAGRRSGGARVGASRRRRARAMSRDAPGGDRAAAAGRSASGVSS